MKILQVIPYFVPAWSYGGPVSVAYNISKELVKRGHEVAVYTTDALDAKNRIRRREEIMDGIRVRRFRNLGGNLVHRNNIFFSSGMLSGIKKELNGFDIIHMHEYRSVQNIIVHHYAVRYGIPYVIQAHGSLPTSTAKQGLKKLYDTIWGYKLLRDASRVIALNETEVGQYKNIGVIEDKIKIVLNGIDLSEFGNLPQRGEFRKKYGLNDSEKVILYLGRIHKTKGLDLLVRAFASLTKKIDGVRLVIVGPDDGYLSRLVGLTRELKAQERVLFINPLYGADKLEAYVDADVHISPRAWEPFGLTLLESCACGTPVICSQGCGIGDIINDKAGFAVPHNEVQLSNAMLYMLSNKKIRQKFGLYGKSLVQEHYNWEKIVGHLEGIYRSCLAGK